MLCDTITFINQEMFCKEFYFFPSAIVKSPLAGDFITMECKKLMEEQKIEVIPPYMIKSKVHLPVFYEIKIYYILSTSSYLHPTMDFGHSMIF